MGHYAGSPVGWEPVHGSSSSSSSNGSGTSAGAAGRRASDLTFRATYLLFGVPWLANLCYIATLTEGPADLVEQERWLMRVLMHFAILIFLSALLHLVTVFAAITLMRGKLRVTLLLWELLCAAAQLGLTNHDVTIMKHGSYNLVGFIAAVLPLSFVLAFGLFVYYLPVGRRCKVALALAPVIALYIVSARSLSAARAQWPRGLFNEKMEPKSEGEDIWCRIHTPESPWDALMESWVVPVFSSWAWRPCPAMPELATFDENFTLTVNCPSSAATTYTVLPWMRDLMPQMFAWVTTHTKHREYLGSPVTINGSAVRAECSAVGFGGGRQQPQQQCNLLLPRRLYPVTRTLEPLRAHAPRNILVLFLDAVPRQGFMRKFSQTLSRLEYLHARGDTHVAQFFRYFAVGHSTRNNARAMFTGRSDHTQATTTVWKALSASYTTALIDNTCVEWSRKYLGRSTPADYNLNALWCLPEYNGNRSDTYELLNGPWSIQRRCLCGRRIHDYMLDYLRLFWEENADKPKFALVKFTEGHEPSASVVGMLDEAIAQLFSDRSYLNLSDTEVWLLSDHGLHTGFLWAVRTHNAIFENKSPGLFLMTPPSLMTPEREQNLRHNKQALLTAYDIYHTLADNAPEDTFTPPHAYSILDDGIPYNRTCDEAKIPHAHCICRRK
eukprot:TRINITY_DN1378_c0_g2_i1.p1 TRINITY_DN1378_c0_g2~~TRINITY_DN1378_c0_g2_i1.p1  ORF type:complete len:668 (-),score=140.78 TRINITY_DN1378_c0_g2_i1:69-2072(-)